MSAPALRGGRGRLTGPDARVLRARDIESRMRHSLEDGVAEDLYVGPFGAYGGDVTNNTGYGQELRLAILPPVKKEFRPSHVRLKVTTSAARNWVCCSLYRYDVRNDSRGMLYQVSGTGACFLTTSTGLKTIELNTTAESPVLTPSSTYFVGAYVSNSGIGLTSWANTSERLLAVNVLPMAHSRETTKSFSVQSLTKYYSRYVPWIVYLSKTGNQLL